MHILLIGNPENRRVQLFCQAAGRLHLPFELLRDHNLAFAKKVGLPTFEVEGEKLTERLNMVSEDGRPEKVFYPVFLPNESARRVFEWHSAPRRVER